MSQQEPYHDYMLRRIREEDEKNHEPTINETLKMILNRLEELEKKVDAYIHDQRH